MLKLFLWLRYLRKKKIVLLSITAVALSVALLIVVNSLFSGYIKVMEKNATASMGDIHLWPGWATIPKYDTLLERLENLDDVEAAAPFSFNRGLLWLESGDVREVAIRGIEPQREVGFTNWKESLLRQQGAAEQVNFEVPDYSDDDGCWLGVGVVAEPDEQTDEYDLTEVRRLIGKRVVLTTIGAGGKRKVKKLRISDIAFTQTYFGDRTLYLPLKKLNTIIFGDDTTQHTWMTKIKLKDGADAVSMKGVIRKVWERFATEELGWAAEAIARMSIGTTQEEQSEYFAELHKQMAILLLIFGVVCSVVVLLIFCIFYMIVMTKQKDIAIMKSCGATSGSAALIFTGFGGCVGIAGSCLGVLFGYVVTSNINTLEEWVRIIFGLKLWRSSSYMLNTIPSQVDWPAIWPIVLIAVAGCCLGALIPAIVAARVSPVKILRYE